MRGLFSERGHWRFCRSTVAAAIDDVAGGVDFFTLR
jgi:hypothetical protein